MENNRRSNIIIGLLINIAVPMCVYFVLRLFLVSPIALLSSAIVPILRLVYKLIRGKKADWIAIISIWGFALSAVFFAVSNGNVILVKLYHPIITGLIGLALFVSAAVKRPLFSIVAVKFGHSAYNDNENFIRRMTRLTIALGLMLSCDAIIHIFLALILSTDAYMVASKFATIILVVLLVLYFRYIRIRAIQGKNNQ